ncbi:response regulator [Escherichia coli]
MQRGIVWVVDDDSSIRWVLERALAGAGLTCTTFENGAEVLEALASKTPDVLLSDIRMPGNGRAGAAEADQTAPSNASGHHYDRTFRSGCCRQRLSTRGV